jgi:hypothetical protein
MGVGSSPRIKGRAPRQAHNHRRLWGLLSPRCCAEVAAPFRPKRTRWQHPLESSKPLGLKASRLHGRGLYVLCSIVP